MKRAKRPRGLAARFKQREIDEIRLSERRAKFERQAMIKGKPIDDYARDRGCSRWTIWNRIRDGEVKAVTLKVAIGADAHDCFAGLTSASLTMPRTR